MVAEALGEEHTRSFFASFQNTLFESNEYRVYTVYADTVTELNVENYSITINLE